MTGVFLTEWRFKNSERQELQKILPPKVVSALEAALNEQDSYRVANRPDRKIQVEQLEKLRDEMTKLQQLISETNEWTLWRIASLVSLMEFRQALEAYTHAADRAAQHLRAKGPKHGPDPDFARSVVWSIKKVFNDNGVPTGKTKADPFIRVIDIAFKAWEIPGEPRKFADLVEAGKL